jgi:hypothetical protein
MHYDGKICAFFKVSTVELRPERRGTAGVQGVTPASVAIVVKRAAVASPVMTARKTEVTGIFIVSMAEQSTGRLAIAFVLAVMVIAAQTVRQPMHVWPQQMLVKMVVMAIFIV